MVNSCISFKLSESSRLQIPNKAAFSLSHKVVKKRGSQLRGAIKILYRNTTPKCLNEMCVTGVNMCHSLRFSSFFH